MSNPFGERLKDLFLKPDRKIKTWAGLATYIIAVFALAFNQFVVEIPLSFARALSRAFGKVETGIRDGGILLSETLQTQAAEAFGFTDFGIFSLPVNLGLILAAVAIVVFGLREVFSE